MKKLVGLLVLVLAVTSQAHAQSKPQGPGSIGSAQANRQPIILSGDDAIELFDALSKVGAIGDSTSGQHGTTAADLNCNVVKAGRGTSSCAVKLQTQNGDLIQKRLAGRKAEILIGALTDVGLGGCGMENCGGFDAKSIDCLAPNDPSADKSENTCTIEK